ncbi:MAG TPA: polysaccharide deacetylase family protein [Candidatus Limnocylindria bacterium]
MRRSISATALALMLVFSASALVPSPTAAAAPSPDNPRMVSFQAGTHTGYRFDADGDIVARKTYTLDRASAASTTKRTAIPGRAGKYLYIVDGIWAGYHVRESMVSYVVGVVGSRTYDSPRVVSFPAGTIIGYRFDDDWNLVSARIGSLGHSSSASARRVAVINGIAYYRIVNGGWAGTWVPKAGTLAVKALSCRTGPRADATRRVVRTVSGAGPEVALTLDMGGRLDPALSIMRYLLLNGVCTTIFPTGASSQTDVGAAVLAMVRAYPQVFEVGNHTMNHCNLVTGENGAACPQRPMTAAEIRKELTSAAAIITEGSGQSPVPYWRPPFGAYNQFVLDAAAGAGYTTTAMWGVDTIDWLPVADGGPTAAQIVGRVVTNVQGGSVVLMHLGGYNTRQALPMTIHLLRTSRDLEPTSLSDLLDMR